MMTIASTNNPFEAKDFDMRPSAVMAIGIAGIRTLPASGIASQQFKADVTDVFSRLSHALQAIVKEHPTCFSATRPILRCVSMVGQGACLEATRVAQSIDIGIACVLPFDVADYLNDFDQNEQPLARELIDAARTCLVLPGTRDESSRAYERAYGVIVANVDVLLVILNGQLSEESDDIRDVIQSAASRGTPIIAISARSAGPASLLTQTAYDELASIIAMDLQTEDLPVDLIPLVRRILLPPTDSAMQRGLEDLVSESNRPLTLRFEYSILLKLFRVSRIQGGTDLGPPEDRYCEQSKPTDTAHQVLAIDDQDLTRRLRRFDQLANYYGQMSRSSATSGFLVIIIVAFLSASVGLIFPFLSGASIAIQIVVNILVLLDITIMKRHRWMERWLDYRAIAERLRSLRFLHPLGLGDVHRAKPLDRKRQSWIDWYVRRCCFELDAPSGRIRTSDIPEIASVLVGREIEAQLSYHRQAFRRFGRLEQRLFVSAYAALAATVAVAAAVGITAHFVGGTQNVAWKPLALLALAVFPAITTAFNGIRADADLVQLVERSALATVALTRLRRALNSSAINFDRVAAAATRVSLLMGDELSEWRFMLENRRLRRSRRLEWRRR
jgi:hypothetical protein